MTIWRISIVAADGDHKGYHYVGSSHKELDARFKALEKIWGNDAKLELERFEVKPGKQGILSALNKFGGHPDNG